MTNYYEVSPAANCGILLAVLIVTLKLWSYTAFWHDVRYFKHKEKSLSKSSAIDKSLQSEVFKEIDEVLNNYPINLTLGNLVEFLCFPVLCYQYKFPRTPRISKLNILKYTCGCLLSLFLQLFILNQYITPLLDNSVIHLEQRNWVKIAERVLKLSVPSTYCWILMFYGTFHNYLNLVAELTCFADRNFYKDWWNSYFLEEYWRKWNIVEN